MKTTWQLAANIHERFMVNNTPDNEIEQFNYTDHCSMQNSCFYKRGAWTSEGLDLLHRANIDLFNPAPSDKRGRERRRCLSLYHTTFNVLIWMYLLTIYERKSLENKSV